MIIERDGELVIRKEDEVLHAIEGEAAFWRGLSHESLKRMWGKEDKIWDILSQENTAFP